jgi:ribonuclease Z
VSLRLALLGTGSAVPDPVRGNPSQAVLVDGEILLFDCGERTTVNLVRAGINPMDVDRLFFTHLHWDHVTDFGYFMLTTWNCGRRRELPIVGPAGTRAMVEASVYGVHATDVAYVREYVRALPPQVEDRPPEEPSFSVEEIDVGWTLETPRYRVRTGAVEHHQRVGTPSVAYRVDCAHGSIALTGDTGASAHVVELARGADVLVHDCAFTEEIIEARGMWSHSSPTIAGRHAREAGVGTLVLTHLGPYTSPAPSVAMASIYYGGPYDESIWDTLVERARAEFDGEVILGRDALVLEVADGRVTIVAGEEVPG